MSSRLIIVYWRDIPAQVIAKKGRKTTAKVQLSERFQVAIDRAAMRAGKGSSDHYLEDWRRESKACSDNLDNEAQATAQNLEASYSDEQLERLIKAGGLQSSD